MMSRPGTSCTKGASIWIGRNFSRCNPPLRRSSTGRQPCAMRLHDGSRQTVMPHMRRGSRTGADRTRRLRRWKTSQGKLRPFRRADRRPRMQAKRAAASRRPPRRPPSGSSSRALQGSPGMSLATLAKATAAGRSTTRQRLHALAALGQVTRASDGRWRLIGGSVTRPPKADESRPIETSRTESRPTLPSPAAS
jgi:hypothetical protein